MSDPGKNIILCGSVGEGKTTFMRGLAESLQERKQEFIGLFAISESIVEARDTYTLEILPYKRRILLASRKPIEHGILWNSWYFNPEAFTEGEKAISNAVPSKIPVLLDEIGKYELDGNGWSRTMDELMSRKMPLIISVRSNMLSKVVDRWLTAWTIYPVHETSPDFIADLIIGNA